MVKLIDAIRSWFLKCPLLPPEKLLSIDKLGADPGGYSIEPLSCTPIIAKYTDGGSMRQFQFAFAGREIYNERQNTKNTEFYEKLVSWVEKQSDKGNLPDLEEGRTAQYIEILSNGYVYDSSDSTAIYQMELSLVYYQKWNF